MDQQVKDPTSISHITTGQVEGSIFHPFNSTNLLVEQWLVGVENCRQDSRPKIRCLIQIETSPATPSSSG